MKNRFILGLALAAAAVSFVGCAATKSSTVSDYNDKAKFKPVIGGPYRMEFIKGISYKVDGSLKQCSNAEFVAYALAAYPTAHDVIQIRADQHAHIVGSAGTTYDCRYSGIAVRYVPVDNWKIITDPLDAAAVGLSFGDFRLEPRSELKPELKPEPKPEPKPSQLPF